MKQSISLHIPEPCHENWNKMTPTRQGKFCSVCSKQVIDFSLMSDNQILNYLKNNTGNLCGRFDETQLQRTLIETKVSRKRSWYAMFVLPFVFLFQKSFGQKTSSYNAKIITNKVIPKEQATVGFVFPGLPGQDSINLFSINGTVKDNSGNPVGGASVVIEETNQGVATDSFGRFTISAPFSYSSVTLTASYIGYEIIKKHISLAKENNEVNFVMNNKNESVLNNVIVTSYLTKQYVTTLGGISICKKFTTKEKLDTSVRKILHINPFTVYPNPAKSGAIIQIKSNEAGNFELQLLSSNSALLIAENILFTNKNSSASFQVPNNISSGVYYLRLIDIQTKKSSLEKIIIQ